ncbi:MAG TPA: HEPN domain-containing protein [Firmicutes bacterium]|nr:HEPN domain-containing protein [Candidatus Fermentithermobacillaceae bacterium]
MKNLTLAQSYLIKAKTRLKILSVLYNENAFSDVVREAQEIVELALKGMLRQIGIEPPKIHDVGDLIVEYSHMFPEPVRKNAETLKNISRWLRKEREFAFYGEVDLIPTLEYTAEDAQRAMNDAEIVVRAAQSCIELPEEFR